jgi:hypothetical protein
VPPYSSFGLSTKRSRAAHARLGDVASTSARPRHVLAHRVEIGARRTA